MKIIENKELEKVHGGNMVIVNSLEELYELDATSFCNGQTFQVCENGHSTLYEWDGSSFVKSGVTFPGETMGHS